MRRSHVFCWIKVLCLLHFGSSVVGWNTDDLELFDLVEEVGQNFYDVLGVTPVSSEQKYGMFLVAPVQQSRCLIG